MSQTITSRINAARKAVGDSGVDQRLIRTVARKGVRFVGDVRQQSMGALQGQATGPSPVEGHEPARPALAPPDRPVIAVLPFTNMSGDPEQEYFSDGISEDLITALSKLRWFFVIARNSSFIYKGKAVHMKQLAEELGVSYVVEGSVRKSGDRLRITAQLNDVATGSHIWAEHYDRDLAEVFAVGGLGQYHLVDDDIVAMRRAWPLSLQQRNDAGLSAMWSRTVRQSWRYSAPAHPRQARWRRPLKVQHFGRRYDPRTCQEDIVTTIRTDVAEQSLRARQTITKRKFFVPNKKITTAWTRGIIVMQHLWYYSQLTQQAVSSLRTPARRQP